MNMSVHESSEVLNRPDCDHQALHLQLRTQSNSRADKSISLCNMLLFVFMLVLALLVLLFLLAFFALQTLLRFRMEHLCSRRLLRGNSHLDNMADGWSLCIC